MLKLWKPPSYHSILKVIRSPDQISAESASNRSHLKIDAPVYAYNQEIETSLVNWVCHMNEQGVFVNDHLIKEKGRRIQEEYYRRVRSQQQSLFNFGNRWISRFLYRILSRVNCTSSTFKVARIRMCCTCSELLSKAVMVRARKQPNQLTVGIPSKPSNLYLGAYRGLVYIE